MSEETQTIDRAAALTREALDQHWYHTIDLAPTVTTKGGVDLRAVAPRVLPEELSGLRALDIGTFDGFWAFELERRGADVVATDLDRFDKTDWPPPNRIMLAERAGERSPGERFWVARELLDSNVTRVTSSVYDLDVERIGGAVDYAVVGDLMIHLRDPVAALERILGVLAPDAPLLMLEQVNVGLTLLRPRRAAASLQAAYTSYNWWEANYQGLKDWLYLAGYERIERRAIYRLKADKAQSRWHVALEARRPGG